MRQGSDSLAELTYGAVEVIDAFANYFKHRDEWHTNWAQLVRRAASTRDIIAACRASLGSTGNLRAGALASGNTAYGAVALFGEQLENWRVRLVAIYEQQLRMEGVI